MAVGLPIVTQQVVASQTLAEVEGEVITGEQVEKALGAELAKLQEQIYTIEHCFDSGKYQAAVQQDVEEGGRFGVTGTPVFFINGRLVSGAQPLERFVQIIEDELTRAR